MRPCMYPVSVTVHAAGIKLRAHRKVQLALPARMRACKRQDNDNCTLTTGEM